MRIENELWTMSGRECDALATELFIIQNNLDRPDKRYKRLLKEAVALKDEIVDDLTMRAVYNYYDDIFLKDDVLVIDGKMFVSRVLDGVHPSQFKGAYVFVLTAGDFSYKDRPMMDQVFYDLWGTAFATAARQHLQTHFSQDGRISEVFGPGLFGIPMSTMKGLVSMVDADRIGVTVNSSNFLLPVKSYGGIYSRVADNYRPRGGTCATCLGSRLSCNLCEYNPARHLQPKA